MLISKYSTNFARTLINVFVFGILNNFYEKKFC